MPFLRVIRDRRGYESTYLMELYRDGARQRSRILYVFRTPGDVRVGRSSLEPETLREIEQHHPGIAFDWNAVVGNQQIVEAAPELRRRKRRAEAPEAGSEVAAREPETPVVAEGVAAPLPRVETGEPAVAVPAIPTVIGGDTPDQKIAFLMQWYPVCRDRIPTRVADPGRHAGLLALAERLNPATWIDANQITEGLLQAAESLERLSRILGKRRRRSRRGTGRAASQSGPVPVTPGNAEPLLSGSLEALDADGHASLEGPLPEGNVPEAAEGDEDDNS